MPSASAGQGAAAKLWEGRGAGGVVPCSASRSAPRNDPRASPVPPAVCGAPAASHAGRAEGRPA